MHVLNARRESLIASGFIQPVQLIRDSVCELLIDVSPRFERRTTISQSACADDTHHSFDRQFYWTVQNHFLSMDPRCVKGPDLSYTSEREKPSKHVGTVTLLSDLTHWAELSLPRRHVESLLLVSIRRAMKFAASELATT